MLLRGLLDVALVHSLPDDMADLDGFLIHEDAFNLVVPAGHRLTEQMPIGAVLGEEKWIALESALSPSFRGRFIAACGAYGFVPSILYEAPDLISVLGLVEAGLGVALLQSTVRRIAPPGVAFIAIPNFKLTVQLHLLRRPASTSKQAKHFVELARHTCVD